MKRRFFSALLCAALLVSLAACGGTSTPPDASAQASFAGEWISYASYKNQKAVPYEYFVWSVLYTLNADGSYTAQSTDGSADVTGKWTGGKDGGALTLWGAHLYLFARVVYVPLYAFGVTGLRSLAFIVSVAGLIMVIAALFV